MIIRRTSDVYVGAGHKRLVAVEVDPERSHQHEFNGSKSVRELLGMPDPRGRHEEFDARLVWLEDDDEPIVEEQTVTWYDARAAVSGRSEARLCYRPSHVVERARPGDVLWVALRHDQTLDLLLAREGSSFERQLALLFDPDRDLDPAVGQILELVGLEPGRADNELLLWLLDRFGGTFPTGREMSVFARETLPDLDPLEDPDAAILAWYERETEIFFALERHLLEHRLEEPLSVDEFLSCAMSVRQRRMSRAGKALEYHVIEVLERFGIPHTWNRKLPDGTQPDFVFPPGSLPTWMLACKTTCKDRWRQVINEAKHLEERHLLTFEPAISEAQTTEMDEAGIVLVVPRALHPSYTAEQRDWLWTFEDLLALVG